MLLINCKRGLLPRSPLRVQLFQRIIHEMNQSRKEALGSWDAPGAPSLPRVGDTGGQGTNPAPSASESCQCQEARSSHTERPLRLALASSTRAINETPFISYFNRCILSKTPSKTLIRISSPPTSLEASNLIRSVPEREKLRRRDKSMCTACGGVPETCTTSLDSQRRDQRQARLWSGDVLWWCCCQPRRPQHPYPGWSCPRCPRESRPA